MSTRIGKFRRNYLKKVMLEQSIDIRIGKFSRNDGIYNIVSKHIIGTKRLVLRINDMVLS